MAIVYLWDQYIFNALFGGVAHSNQYSLEMQLYEISGCPFRPFNYLCAFGGVVV